MGLQVEVNGYVCRKTDNLEVLYEVLLPAVKDSTPSIEESNKRKLKSYLKACDNLICYAPNGEVVGACVYRYAMYGIELIHMWVEPRYRVTYGSGLLNYFLINVIGEGKEIRLTTSNVSTFEKVVEPYGKLGQYRIVDRARVGLNKMLDSKVIIKVV